MRVLYANMLNGFVYNITFNKKSKFKKDEFLGFIKCFDTAINNRLKYIGILKDTIMFIRCYKKPGYVYIDNKCIGRILPGEILNRYIKINNRYRLFYGKLVDYRDIDLVERIDYVKDPLMDLCLYKN